ncbi:MAG: hypothetical protein SFU91_12360 [Chloroherpetonaceae bacterium]|nr:hypothetical protein [Chloroherpetonaceae bacterium]
MNPSQNYASLLRDKVNVLYRGGAKVFFAQNTEQASYYDIGFQSDLIVTAEAATRRDSKGREEVRYYDISVAITLAQTSDTERAIIAFAAANLSKVLIQFEVKSASNINKEKIEFLSVKLIPTDQIKVGVESRLTFRFTERMRPAVYLSKFKYESLPSLSLISPSQALVDSAASVAFSWQSLSGYSQYRLEVFLNESLTETSFNGVINGTTHSLSLQQGLRYWWRVTALAPDISLQDVVSGVRFFTTFIQSPSFVSPTPADLSTDVQIGNIIIGWPALVNFQNATGFDYVVSLNSTYTNIVLQGNDVTINEIVVQNESFGVMYYVRLRVRSAFAVSTYVTRQFQVEQFGVAEFQSSDDRIGDGAELITERYVEIKRDIRATSYSVETSAVGGFGQPITEFLVSSPPSNQPNVTPKFLLEYDQINSDLNGNFAIRVTKIRGSNKSVSLSRSLKKVTPFSWHNLTTPSKNVFGFQRLSGLTVSIANNTTNNVQGYHSSNSRLITGVNTSVLASLAKVGEFVSFQAGGTTPRLVVWNDNGAGNQIIVEGTEITTAAAGFNVYFYSLTNDTFSLSQSTISQQPRRRLITAGLSGFNPNAQFYLSEHSGNNQNLSNTSTSLSFNKGKKAALVLMIASISSFGSSSLTTLFEHVKTNGSNVTVLDYSILVNGSARLIMRKDANTTESFKTLESSPSQLLTASHNLKTFVFGFDISRIGVKLINRVNGVNLTSSTGDVEGLSGVSDNSQNFRLSLGGDNATTFGANSVKQIAECFIVENDSYISDQLITSFERYAKDKYGITLGSIN